MIKNKKLYVIALVVLVVAFFISMPFINRLQMRARNDDAIKKFYSLELYSPITSEDNRIINGGDGIDSKPYLQVERELGIKAMGGEAEELLVKNLKKQSIKIIEKQYKQRCSAGEVEAYYRLLDVQGREITINIGSDFKSLSSGCHYESISASLFNSHNVTYLFARTYMQ